MGTSLIETQPMDYNTDTMQIELSDCASPRNVWQEQICKYGFIHLCIDRTHRTDWSTETFLSRLIDTAGQNSTKSGQMMSICLSSFWARFPQKLSVQIAPNSKKLHIFSYKDKDGNSIKVRSNWKASVTDSLRFTSDRTDLTSSTWIIASWRNHANLTSFLAPQKQRSTRKATLKPCITPGKKFSQLASHADLLLFKAGLLKLTRFFQLNSCPTLLRAEQPVNRLKLSPSRLQNERRCTLHWAASLMHMIEAFHQNCKYQKQSRWWFLLHQPADFYCSWAFGRAWPGTGALASSIRNVKWLEPEWMRGLRKGIRDVKARK